MCSSDLNQRDRRQNGKKRNIPSAAKIEQYLNIHDTADKVRFAAAHVMGKPVEEEPFAVTIPAPEDSGEPLVVVVSEPVTVAEEAFVFSIEGEDVDSDILIEDSTDEDRKSTRLNSSHVCTSYAAFCLKKKIYKTQSFVRI